MKSKRNAVECKFRILPIAIVAAICLSVLPVEATPWNPSTSAVPFPGAGIPSPAEVPGKDFSDHRDRDANAAFDPEQVVAWDGFGGVRDSVDFSGSRPPTPPGLELDMQVDAIAHGADALFHAVIDDRAALLFSVGNSAPGGPGDAQVYFEASNGFGPPPVTSGVWATPPEIDNMALPNDVDGLEVWGNDNFDDTDRYSLYTDPWFDFGPLVGPRKVAVWEYDAINNATIPHILTVDLAMAMDLQYGFGGTGPLFNQLAELMDVDATMVFGDQLLYSIAPIALSQIDPALPDFDGGEIFVYDGPGAVTRFLRHAGHDWDTAFDVMGTFANLGVMSENINALEAVATPEPASAVLMLLVAAGFCRLTYRRRFAA